jgi:hypothetical protein
MQKKIRKICYCFLFLFTINIVFNGNALCQELAVKKQTDGTIKIQSTPSEMKVRISNMVYCRTIDELIKEEKDNVNRLISDNRYEEVKDSIEILEGLRLLKMQKCK